MAKKRSKRQKAILKRRIFLLICFIIIIAIIGIICFSINALLKAGKSKSNSSNQSSSSSSQISSETSSGGKTNKSVPETTATVINTGDIIVHSTQLDGAYVKSTGGYDFSAFFKEASPFFKAADLAVANLEVTLGGSESGKYSGYPAFNTPDSLVDTIKSSGLNFLLTSNNHAYDTGLFGLKRTVQVLKQKGLDHTGTRETESDPAYAIKDVNGIKIGIANFTFETDGKSDGRKFINGAIISSEANNLINTFSYQHIDDFYNQANEIIKGMKSGGADYIVFYMHWGQEYQTSPNTWQKTIAQKLSNFGVNMIIGSHPHVIQPVELIKPEGGEGSTVCLYSTGNCISNQRQELMDSCPSGHTEDGMLFSFTLKKASDGTTLSGLNLIPAWVNKYKGGSGYQYTLYPLETPNAGSEKYSLPSSAASKAQKSYERTKQIVSDGLTKCQQDIGCDITFK